MPIYTEKAFEDCIEEHLLANGYARGDPGAFDRGLCLFPEVLVSFMRDTQPDTWDYLYKLHGARTEAVILDDLCRAMDTRGSLDVIRHGFKCFGKPLRVAYFAPANLMNPETQRLYAANRLTVTRQLKFDPDSEQSIDLVLSLNGIPVVTAELKNQLTGQTVEDGKRQYFNRDKRQKIFEFKKHALVHFAVDTDVAYMTTKLAGKSTSFLPFNLGRDNAAGNPDVPDKHKTAYLWEEVWARDSLLDLLARFLHLEKSEKTFDGKKVTKEKMIFPRYHQLDSVRKLITAAREEGPGNNYLIQHSAGSGKSNSIAWLAHRLTSLHDERDEKVFNSVVVITDRLVLDKQLQDTIYQFEHKQGVVQKIDVDSTQLAEALKAGVPIVITTLQKFPFVTEKVGDLPDKKYAVIVDEAHSSQSGESATTMKGVLAGESVKQKAAEEAEELSLPDYEEEILKTMAERGRQPNISFFAFTATPKYKTMEVFGHTGPDGKPVPFHLYSMRQAIEEEFILDVLKNYTTYNTYYGLIKSIEDDPEVNKRKAAQALARYLSLHPHNLAQKTEVMVEHFRANTRHKIGNKAKAMVLTRSRLHAVRYKQTFDKYIEENGYDDIKTLVAFSGTVIDPDIPGKDYTEVAMNKGIREKELPDKFATNEYQVLLVAEKYQTGFDQPLLHTMYVDKRLAGVQAVQALSRLNRTRPGKEDTFVLDFVNDPEDIYESFKPYYERTYVGEQVDPRQLYDLQAKMNEWHVYYIEEVEQFCKAFFKPKTTQTARDHALINSILDPAVSRFRKLSEEEQEEFKKLLVSYRNLYSFLSQIIPYQDSDLEKLYAYTRHLLAKLPRRDTGPAYRFDDEVALKYYRLEKISEGTIELSAGGEVDGPTEVGTRAAEAEEIELSRLIDIINERFGTDFTIADELFFDQVREEAVEDEELRQSAFANTIDNFKYPFLRKIEDIIIDRMEQNEEIFAKFMNIEEFRDAVVELLLRRVYKQIRDEGAA